MIQTYIPFRDVPQTERAGASEIRWFGNDSESRYRKDPHPTLSPADVSYRFNRHGYRSVDLSDRSACNVLFIGCSWIFGSGVPFEDTAANVFGRLLQDRLGKPVTVWNLGFLGRSNDFISRTLVCSLPVLKPDVVFVNFTFSSRREYFPLEGPPVNLLSSRKTLRDVSDPIHKRLMKNLFDLASDREDGVNLFRNYKVIEAVLSNSSAKWLFSTNRFEEFSAIEEHVDRDRFVLPGMQVLDRARDNSHPGVASNKHLAEQILERYADVYGH